MLAEPSRNVVLGVLLAGVLENGFGEVVLYQVPHLSLVFLGIIPLLDWHRV